MKTVEILGVPLDHGAGRRGVSVGPAALRLAGLQRVLEQRGYNVRDRGDVDVPVSESVDPGDPKVNARYLPLVAKTCASLSAEVTAILNGGNIPLVIGGDHSMAIGSISGLAHYAHQQSGEIPPKVGVLWFDAHADINNPKVSPSGNIHGMPVACLLHDDTIPTELKDIGYAGAKIAAENCVQIGLRDVDPEEKQLVRDSGIHAFTMADIDKKGMAQTMEQAIQLAKEGVDYLHVSFDIDVLDPRIAPGTGTKKAGGLTYREAHLALEMVASAGGFSSFELVEVNPLLDDRNMTAELAVDLITSAFGERIL